MYVDLAGLARYKSDFGAWARGALLPKDAAAARVRTAKAGAVSFVPVQETPLDVSVDFLFTEMPPTSGDKGPENPSTISGVSSVKVTRCGKNLFFKEYSNTKNGVTVIVDSDGIITFNGTSTANAGTTTEFSLYNRKMKITAGQTLAFKYEYVGGTATPPSGVSYTDFVQNAFVGNGVSIIYKSLGNTSADSALYIFNEDRLLTTQTIKTIGGVSYNNYKIRAQLELCSENTSFEPPVENSIAIQLGATYYGGTLDAAAGVMTVTHSGMTLNGDTYLSTGIFDEQSDVYGVGFYPDPERLMTLSDSSDAACSILPVAVGTGAKNYPCAYLANNAMGIRLQFSKTSLGLGDGVEASEVRTAVKAFLAQHPGFIVWPVASPAAVQLTPTEIFSLTQSSVYDPRVNTVYSDQQAVQVGYLKHPSAASSDLRNALVSLGGGV